MDPLTAIPFPIDDDAPIFDALVQEQFNTMLETTMRVSAARQGLELPK